MANTVYTTTLPYTTTGSPGYTLGVGNGTSATDFTWTSTATPVTISQNATINLKGDGADIVINGESLNKTLKEIKDALGVPGNLQRDPQLEKKWDELKAAAEHYETLLEEYREKQKVWDIMSK